MYRDILLSFSFHLQFKAPLPWKKSTFFRVLELGVILSFELPKKNSWVVAPQTNLSPTQFYNLIALGYGNMIAVFISDIAVGVD